MVAHHVANDRQAEAGPAGVTTPAAVDPVEPFEHALLVAGRDAAAVITDVELHDLAVR